jgi:ABC-type Zn uptake system ZnuABC Zn-binding protein ZnuA
MRRGVVFVGIVLAASAAIGLGASPERLQVVATTTIVGDVVRSVAGDGVDLHVLFSVNADPHSFVPTPSDVVRVEEADVVFISGAGLEANFEGVLASATGRVIDLSSRLALREIGEVGADEHEHDHEGHDPHVWFDPTNVMIWADTVEAALGALDPSNAAWYAANAAAYRSALSELDSWVWERVASIPRDLRLLVTDHLSFGYFAERYGFTQVGSVLPGFSTLSEPSAREMADLTDSIRTLGVPAIFVGTTVNPDVAEQLAADMDIELVVLYTGSLSEPWGQAATYIDMMRYDVNAIADGLNR